MSEKERSKTRSPRDANIGDYWRRVGPLLEAIHREELRAMTDAEAVRSLGLLGNFALSLKTEERTTSGLAEMQRRFQEAWGCKTTKPRTKHKDTDSEK